MDNFQQLSPSTPPKTASVFSSEGQVFWAKIKERLSKELSDITFNTWFAPLNCIGLNQEKLLIGVPDAYFGQWLQNHYHDLIHSLTEEIAGKKLLVDYRVISTPEVKTAPVSRSPQVLPLTSKEHDLNTKYTFDNFVIGPGNRFAHAAAMAVCEAPAKQYNPLFIYGPVGLGKTHLMQSIAHVVKKKNPSTRVLYISSEKFTNHLISSIQNRSTAQFRSTYRGLDFLLIDDIHFLAEKEATQEEFFHTFNTLFDAHKQIIVCSDRPPKEIPGLEERLVSRFGWGLVTDINPPDFETRVAILKKKMEKETAFVPDDVLFFIASKIRSNIRELEGALIRVVAYSTLTGEKIDLRLAQSILKASFKEEEQKVTIELIQRKVAEYFNLSVSDLRAKRRTYSVARPRQIAMFLVRSLTTHSLPEIGEYFGGRDHTTVLHAFNKIENEMEQNPDTQKTVELIRELLKKGD